MSSVSLGYDPPKFKRKYITNKQHSSTASGAVGISSAKPTMLATLAVTKLKSSTAEAAEDTVCLGTTVPVPDINDEVY